eukprot:GEMP01081324.1.p1 GENE.GEMP01081324.1~~GEMP01081324.1.p1  ORF type:complete len:170 (+),score=42.87 GEMP01081324.1:83-592(+)
MQRFSGFTDTMFKEGAISSTHPLKKEPCSSPVLDESVYIPDTRRQADVPSPPDDIGRLSRPASSLVPEKRALKGRVLSLAALPVKDTTSRRSSLELLAANSHAPPPRRSMSGSSCSVVDSAAQICVICRRGHLSQSLHQQVAHQVSSYPASTHPRFARDSVRCPQRLAW